MTVAGSNCLRFARRRPSSPRPALVTVTAMVLVMVLVTVVMSVGVSGAGRVLFPGSERGPASGGSESALWIWRSPSRDQSRSPRLLPVGTPARIQAAAPQPRPSRLDDERVAPLRDGGSSGVPPAPVTPSRRPPVLARLEVTDVQPESPTNRRPVPVHPVVQPVVEVPSVSLRGLPDLPLDPGSNQPQSYGRLVGAAEEITHPIESEVAPNAAETSPLAGGGAVFGGHISREGRGEKTVLNANDDVNNNHFTEVVIDSAPLTLQTNKLPALLNTRTFPVTSVKENNIQPTPNRLTATPSVTPQADTISMTSPSVYYDNDVIAVTTNEQSGGVRGPRKLEQLSDDPFPAGLLIKIAGSTNGPSEGQGPLGPRKLEQSSDDLHSARLLINIASLDGTAELQKANSIEDAPSEEVRLELELLSCPKLGGNLTLACRVDGRTEDIGTVQRFRWGKRLFDRHNGLMGDELIAVDGRPFRQDKFHIETAGEGYQRLTVSDVTSSDAGLYLCHASLGRPHRHLHTELAVVLCRR
ncbi:uncharacterized protein LOC122367326 isoform X1 [Amphibalanus amphitrite]|uniref:uncharacterized protein LOC122367326 isoform X1 n=1 Tax=Amphibalanus amphitrite TaxID=1232801 RepID=UPI001C8FDAC2|nr:uncharacterized protein LOC122367326 isoform X1 [Amphibalanus amphitrite]